MNASVQESLQAAEGKPAPGLGRASPAPVRRKSLPSWAVPGIVWFLPAVVLAAPPPSTETDWPQLLGPHANGVSAETGLANHWSSNGPPLIWSQPIGTGYSAPSVRGQWLVAHHRQENEEIVEAKQAATGTTVWRYAYPSQFLDPYGYNNGPRSTPCLTSNRCYTLGAEGRLLCLELATGKRLWERDTGRDWKVPEAFFGVGSSPLLLGDLLIVMVGGQPNAGVVAFNARTGATVWEAVGASTWQGWPKTGWPGEPPVNWSGEDKQASYSTPVLCTLHGRRRILCLTRQGLVALDPASGRLDFRFWFRSRVPQSVNAMNPVIVDDLIFISAAYYRIGSVLLRVRPEGTAVDEVWRSPVLEQHWSTPLYHAGYLYAFSGRNEIDARFRCVELKTGRLMWERDESWRRYRTKTPPVYGRGSALMAEGKLIVLGEGGLLGLFAVDPREPRELARGQVPGLHYPCWAGPVLSRKRLFLRSEDRLVCLDLAR